MSALAAILAAGCFSATVPPAPDPVASESAELPSIRLPPIGDASYVVYESTPRNPLIPWRLRYELEPRSFRDAWGIAHEGIVLTEVEEAQDPRASQVFQTGIDRCGVMLWWSWSHSDGAWFETGANDLPLDGRAPPAFLLLGNATLPPAVVGQEAGAVGEPSTALQARMGRWSLETLAIGNNTVDATLNADDDSLLRNSWRMTYDGHPFPALLGWLGGTYRRVEAETGGGPFGACESAAPSRRAPQDFTTMGRDGPLEQPAVTPSMAEVMASLHSGAGSVEARAWLERHPDYVISLAKWSRGSSDQEVVRWGIYIDDPASGDRMVAWCPPTAAPDPPPSIVVPCDVSEGEGFRTDLSAPYGVGSPVLRHDPTMDLLGAFHRDGVCVFAYVNDGWGWRGQATPCGANTSTFVDLSLGAVLAGPSPVG